ncbi:MAG: hypothetical protein A2040_15505 [Rhodocyclales bacterium GWA2_65_19]|nr:MAG: hypothetical protein A2040_15505 [Rhodocyclales bacterium GWA2_65_19]
MQAFVWNERFTTGIELVDTQHHRLVDIVNRVGDMLLDPQLSDKTSLEDIFRELADYANTHFRDEERLMQKMGVTPAHFQHHVNNHRNFVAQLTTMWRARGLMSAPADTLHGFLVAWLSYHILGEDQAMAREIRRVNGVAPSVASPTAEPQAEERSTDALLDALHNLYGVLSHINGDLMRANSSLEAEVAARTRELTAANHKLQAEQRELAASLQRVSETQNQLLQSEKMAAIGQLAAGVAHEINNPVGFVSSNLGTLGHYVEDLLRVIDAAADCPPAQAAAQAIELPFVRQDLAALLAESRDGLERVRQIVANLKDFSHVDQAEWQQADLLAGLESTINVVWHELKYKTEIRRELQPLPPVRCLPAQINQVLMNLLLNAAQAIPAHGTITLRSGLADPLHDGQVWIEVADDGIGMEEETRRRLFEPFFTTKPVGQGTGLGLSLSWDIVHTHGGSFEVDSAPGAGSRIRLWLPIDGPPAE